MIKNRGKWQIMINKSNKDEPRDLDGGDENVDLETTRKFCEMRRENGRNSTAICR